MNANDALFNWLQIKIVADARPDDKAAADTLKFFEEILEQDHQVTDYKVALVDDTMIHVSYKANGAAKRQMYDRQTAEQLLQDINDNPQYND